MITAAILVLAMVLYFRLGKIVKAIGSAVDQYRFNRQQELVKSWTDPD